MKVAILFSGYIGNCQKSTTTTVASSYEDQELFLKLCFNHWNKYLLSKENIDIYAHSWDTKYETLIQKYFQPTVIKTEQENKTELADFEKIIHKNGIRLTDRGKINQIYGYKKVWDLFEPFSNNYDVIIHARYAMCLHKSFELDNLKPNTMYTVKLMNGQHANYAHHVHGFFEDPIISTSTKGSKEISNAINYLTDGEKYKLWKAHDGHFNDSLNCVSAHRTTYHILHILKKYHNINFDWIPGFIYTNHYHSSSFNYCRHLYFGHLDVCNRRGRDPMFDNMNQRESLWLPENILLLKNDI